MGLALGSGVRVVQDNQGEAPYDEVVTLRARTGIRDVLPPAVERVKRVLGEQPDMS